MPMEMVLLLCVEDRILAVSHGQGLKTARLDERCVGHSVMLVSPG
jgi:hypothetical protein